MMIEPPIDKLVEKVGCKYEAACGIAKRARFILDKNQGSEQEMNCMQAINQAAFDLYNGKIELKQED